MSPFLRDLAERVLWTALQSATSAALLAPAFNLDALQVAGFAALTAVLSLLKGVAASRLAGKGTAQLGTTTY